MPTIRHNLRISPTDIVDRIRTEYHCNISYSKAHRAKWKAIERIFGNWEQSYAKLPLFLEAMKRANPGTMVEFDGKVIYENCMGRIVRQFERVFWAFGSTIVAFRRCRPLLCIDGTNLYGKYKDNLLKANAIDVEDGLVPLAFAIVESENTENRHSGILSALQLLEKDMEIAWHHRFCMRHLINNFKKKFKSKELSDMVWRAATIKCREQFAEEMRKILTVNPAAREWVDQVPPYTWALCYDDGYRYGIMTTNESESMNRVLKDSRMLPITAIVQQTYLRVAEYFYTRREAAEGMTSDFVPSMQRRLERFTHDARAMQVRRLDQAEFIVQDKNAVTFIVFLRTDHAECQCNIPILFHYPCAHVMAACGYARIIPGTYVSHWFSVDAFRSTYAHTFHAVDDENRWPAMTENDPIFVPPTFPALI